MKAFNEKFGTDPNVILKLHGRIIPGAKDGFENFFKIFERTKSSTITVQKKAFNRQEFETFLTSLDCYISISQGEGFSIVPREALAAGIPCIVTDNSAQSTICSSHCVYCVSSKIIKPCSSMYGQEAKGYLLDCTLEDMRTAHPHRLSKLPALPATGTTGA